MMRMMIAGVACLISGIGDQAAAKPLKVFILAGQSNMQGHVNIKRVVPEYDPKQGYHYLGTAKIMAPIGKAFAEAIVNLQKNQPKKP